ncbi:protein kinase domain-containing protein, partial [Kribbella sancticallisti]|uniref:protein kinase domain-containing protein n=1 Tax=Kribbella sancticallisti TaxID=460087 RepID=UPI0031D48414
MALEDLAGYSLRRGLGSGSVGTVWLLRDLASGRHAVLKRVPKTSIPSAEAFTTDIALARSIDHPHVARLLDVREAEGEWLLFSQYVAAGTLAALLERRGPLSLGELVTLISPLAQGLAAMHRAGLVHGHLDLRDVMFDADGRPVITDAGLRLQEYSGSPQADLAALATIARQAGGSPTQFPDSLFTGDGDHLSRQILHLAPPAPIHLGQTSTTRPHHAPTTPAPQPPP